MSDCGLPMFCRSACRSLFAAVMLGFAAQPGLRSLAADQTVEQWGMYEVAVKGPTNGNPFLDVRFTARFAQGYDSIEVAGFYDGDGMYRARFLPEKTGDWKYETISSAPELNGKTGEF